MVKIHHENAAAKTSTADPVIITVFLLPCIIYILSSAAIIFLKSFIKVMIDNKLLSFESFISVSLGVNSVVLCVKKEELTQSGTEEAQSDTEMLF
jgi:hypothetical protein